MKKRMRGDKERKREGEREKETRKGRRHKRGRRGGGKRGKTDDVRDGGNQGVCR